ncbi:MAG: putative metal-binding motif-containing protein, partial [Sedimentisphaerales bacterium]|nr:putative metal-binding motif-containing protein [Sedimentisphaerales bacterium]
MFRNKTNIVPVAFLLSIIVTFGWLEAAQLLPYYATDPNSSYPYGIDNAPNSLDPRTGWSNPVDDGNGPQVGPIQPGQVVWLAFNNRPDPTRKKYVKIELRAVSGSVGRVNIAHGTGFADANTSGAINGTPTGNADHSATLLRKQYKFKKQPRWERFKVINKSNNPVTFTVNAWSICGNYTGDWNMLLVERGSFGAEDAMVSYDPAVEVQCFAESAALDPYAASVLVSHAPGSGPWSSEVLFVDPDGEPRPQGGVRFTTSGTGLMPGELFDLAMWMDLAPDEEKDIRYFIYTLDSVGFWDKYEIDLTDEECDGEVFDGDVDRNCRVNFMDVALLGANWLRCNDPNDPLCVAPDADGDGWDSGSDCDDGNPLVHPDRPEICGNELDDNCDDLVDSEDPACWECTNGQTRLCEKQEGVCSGSEEICIDNMWSGCDYAAYSADYEPTEITCDGLDNDCDGVPDDGNPGGGAACDGPDSDLCMEGIEECIGGFLVCSDNTSSNLDICDGLDNDCDASSPDGSEDPLAATPCDGPDSDLCMEGMQECIGGFLVCSDHTGSELDLCDGMDNDCDPASPDGSEDPLTGEPCDGPDSDLCMEGTQQCTGGALICSDNTSSTLDVCDGYDNDCDPASPDGSEDPQTGEPCDGPDSDLCMEGMRECTGGEFSCSDHTSSTVDLCDGMDNDCDPASPDGSEDPQTGTACDGPDSDLCAEGIQQ